MLVKRTAMVLCFCALAAFPVEAQTPNADGDAAAPQEYATPKEAEANSGSFGLNTQDYVVHAYQFISRLPAPNWIHDASQYFGNNTATAGRYGAAVELPAGALITGFQCHVRDASTLGDLFVSLFRDGVHVTTGVPLISEQLAFVSSTGNAGYQVISTVLGTPAEVRYRNGNERNMFWLFLQMPADTAANISFRDCVIEWHRQVTPAPATATFPNDVPTTHPFFRFVEALAASGVTSGCAPGSFCPDSPVTRGQMAVFLSAALGLHFPN